MKSTNYSKYGIRALVLLPMLCVFIIVHFFKLLQYAKWFMMYGGETMLYTQKDQPVTMAEIFHKLEVISNSQNHKQP